jgi:hypothetical protein
MVNDRQEFWKYIEQCRTASHSMKEFAQQLESLLDTWEFPALAAFHRIMWSDIGVYHDEGNGELSELMSQQVEYLDSDDAWEWYGGWLIAQGQEFFEAVLRDPQVALTRLPSPEDVRSVTSLPNVLPEENRQRSLYRVQLWTPHRPVNVATSAKWNRRLFKTKVGWASFCFSRA